MAKIKVVALCKWHAGCPKSAHRRVLYNDAAAVGKSRRVTFLCAGHWDELRKILSDTQTMQELKAMDIQVERI